MIPDEEFEDVSEIQISQLPFDLNCLASDLSDI